MTDTRNPLKPLLYACVLVFGSLMVSLVAEGNARTFAKGEAQKVGEKHFAAKRGIASVSPAESLAPSDQGQALSMLRMKNTPDAVTQIDSAHKAPVAFGGICRSANGLAYTTDTQFHRGYADCNAASQASTPNGYFGPAQGQAGAAIFIQ